MRRLVFAVIATGLVLMVLMVGSAFADIPDPLTKPVESIGLVERLWRGGQLLQAGIIVAFLVLSVLAKKVAWFAQGQRGVYVAALLGGAAILAEAASRGATPTLGLTMTAVMTTVAMLFNPRAPGEVASGQKFAAAVLPKARVVHTSTPPEGASQR